MTDSPPTYHAFLLRLRWADNAGRPVWRISLERPGQSGQMQFESLSALCTYLAAQMQTTEEKGGASEEIDAK